MNTQFVLIACSEKWDNYTESRKNPVKVFVIKSTNWRFLVRSIVMCNEINKKQRRNIEKSKQKPQTQHKSV